MNGIGVLLIIGIVMVFLLSKIGGVGCCGGHSHHGSHRREPDRLKPRGFPRNRESAMIIDLKPDEYEVLSERSE